MEVLIDYNDIYFETATLKLEMETLSDDSLLDECNQILGGFYNSESMEDVLLNYFKSGKISKEERKQAEGLYLLAYGEFGWEA
jgi:hypothetical protein